MNFQFAFARPLKSLSVSMLISLLFMTPIFPQDPEGTSELGQKTGVYFPSSCLYGRNLAGIAHYMEAAGLNLAVLHAKDPMGRLFWQSADPLAESMQASVSG